MSIQAVAWALEQDLPARPKLVLVSLANHANHTDGYCWLKAETVAGEAACTSRSVYKYVGGLVRNGYIRKARVKGDDGKQRANDYWLLLAREPAKWDWGAGLADDHDGEDGEPAVDDGVEVGTEEAPEPSEPLVSPADEGEATTATSSEPHAPFSVGENDQKDDPPPVDKHVYSHGPSEHAFSRKSIAEPSKIKPKESLRRDFSGPPRGYRPPPQPPPQPIGAAVNEAKQIFVFDGTRAWDAWAAYKTRERGVRWTLKTTTMIDGKSCTGWWFPSLFPPKADGAPDSIASAAELKEFADTG